MNFPIQSSIQPQPYGPKKTGAILRIDGNAGLIPPSFQTSIWTEEPEEVCAMSVVQMTDEQWAAWTDQDSETYILQSMAEVLGLTLVAPAAKPRAAQKKTRR